MSTRIGGVAEVTESGLRLPIYDYVSNTSASTSDTYIFKLGGSSGETVCTVAIVYTDNTKATILTVTRTPHL